ncbi:MAG: ATP-binding cassette domain-containing protein [Alphaproteobacteria bacterium]|nr:ATP-binding cassette domain-containing protein [Alphaproteobacteria bacterium]
MSSLLAVRGLVKRYGATTALGGIDLDCARGDCIAVVGESGSGKTTLGRILIGAETADAGSIAFDGAALLHRRPLALRRRIQVVQQNPMSALNPRRTVAQSIALPLEVHRLRRGGAIRARVLELLDRVGLSADFADRVPAALSGGQRQRVALARALAAEPDFLVLDEPTSALDVSVQARILQLLAGLRAEFALTYLFITHDLAVVRNIATSVVVLYRGQVVESGPTEALFARPAHHYTAMLLSSLPVISDEEEALKPAWHWDRETGLRDSFGPGCPFRRRCPAAAPACERAVLTREVTPGHHVACVAPYEHGR